MFGLGNKQYEHFNAMGKKAHKALAALGGTQLVRRGDGDDDGCIDDDFDKWVAELLPALSSVPDLLGCDAANNATGNGGAIPPTEVAAYDVEVMPAGTKVVAPFPASGSGKDHHSPYLATITAARELHGPSSDRSCVHVEVDISGADAHYEAGDHVAVYAQNSSAVVEEVGRLLGQPLDTVICLKAPATASGTWALWPGVGCSQSAGVISRPVCARCTCGRPVAAWSCRMWVALGRGSMNQALHQA